jgi:hypothetical protein
VGEPVVLQITVFWNVTLFCPVDFTGVMEEHIVSIFRVKASQILHLTG